MNYRCFDTMVPTAVTTDDTEWIERSHLFVSTMRDLEVVVYPDSEKIGIWGEAPGAPNRKLLRADATVDYRDDES